MTAHAPRGVAPGRADALMTGLVMVALIALAVVIAFQLAVLGSRPTVVNTWREPPWFPAPSDARDIVRLPAQS
jgi:hypothetical protein